MLIRAQQLIFAMGTSSRLIQKFVLVLYHCILQIKLEIKRYRKPNQLSALHWLLKTP